MFRRVARLLRWAVAVGLVGALAPAGVGAQVGPTVLDRNLVVRTAAEDLTTPVSLAFLGPGDMLVLEKDTGRVKRVVNGAVRGTVLDLAVNSASERGLLG